MQRAPLAVFLGIGAACALFSCAESDEPSAPQCEPLSIPPATDTADARADALLSQLTRAEKLQLVHGAAPTNWGGIRLPLGALGYIPAPHCSDLPDLYFADGSVGVRDSVGPATALPSSIASAASWD